ncbi:molybdopterin molybdotransferase MoeA [Ascidiimonas aurantiaca]|uniref:molybdopterin molybdotransferase MoeA n=1 Tax=Ascidiimonas aurantiaca TaxID=1685432 RepID=UPI0030EC1A95
MIAFNDAFAQVMQYCRAFDIEKIPLEQASGRILAEDIFADRDFPPFNRATRDGIAISFQTDKVPLSWKSTGIVAAGTSQTILSDASNCVEIMTGAVVPDMADTIIMYEDLESSEGYFRTKVAPVKGQFIHYKGSDMKKGAKIIKAPQEINAAIAGVLAAVGKKQVTVYKQPIVTCISSGNELVPVDQEPLPHQIRRSNTQALEAALNKRGVVSQTIHLPDDKEKIHTEVEEALKKNDVLLISGGVSKGKYDYLPEVLDTLGVEKIFHRVRQRPGKPFWFGVHKALNTVVFSFPGNPVSTFAGYYLYFYPWLRKCYGLPLKREEAVLKTSVKPEEQFTRFIPVSKQNIKGSVCVTPVFMNGSGDLLSLASADGFVIVPPSTQSFDMGAVVSFVPIT